MTEAQQARQTRILTRADLAERRGNAHEAAVLRRLAGEAHTIRDL